MKVVKKEVEWDFEALTMRQLNLYHMSLKSSVTCAGSILSCNMNCNLDQVKTALKRHVLWIFLFFMSIISVTFRMEVSYIWYQVKRIFM